jgi:uncharacterized OsmC-like protein
MPTLTPLAAEAGFRADPATAKSTPTVTATLVDGHARISAGAFGWDADLPVVIGGGNTAPSPTAYLLGALAGCGVAFLRDILAPQFGVELEDVSAIASARSDLRGLLGIDDAAPELTDLALDLRVISSSDPARVEAMYAAWRERCPIYLALVRPAPIALTTRVEAR